MTTEQINKAINEAVEHLNSNLENTEAVKQAIINAYTACEIPLSGKPRKSKIGGYYVPTPYGFPRKYHYRKVVEKVSDNNWLIEKGKTYTTQQLILDDDFEDFINSLHTSLHEALIRKNG